MKKIFQICRLGMKQYGIGLTLMALIIGISFGACASNKSAPPEPVAEKPALQNNSAPAPQSQVVVIPEVEPVIEPASVSDSSLTITRGTKIVESQQYRGHGITDVVFPDSMTTIEDYAFAFNRISRIVIPESVTYIGKLAFYGNPIRDITIGSNVKFGEVPFLNGYVVYYFIEYYENNGRQKGHYTYNYGRWTYESP